MKQPIRFVGLDAPPKPREKRRIRVSGTMLEHSMHRAPDGSWDVNVDQAALSEFTLSVRELARARGWSVSTARRRIAAGEVPVVERGGKNCMPRAVARVACATPPKHGK